mgnify:CR=1 FL=1
MYEKNSIIQRKLRIINLLLAEVVVRKLSLFTKLSANISQKLFINNSLTVKSYYL